MSIRKYYLQVTKILSINNSPETITNLIKQIYWYRGKADVIREGKNVDLFSTGDLELIINFAMRKYLFNNLRITLAMDNIDAADQGIDVDSTEIRLKFPEKSATLQDIYQYINDNSGLDFNKYCLIYPNWYWSLNIWLGSIRTLQFRYVTCDAADFE